MNGTALTTQHRASAPPTASKGTSKLLAASERGLAVLERPFPPSDFRDLTTLAHGLNEQTLGAAIELLANLPSADSEKARAMQIAQVRDRGPDLKATVGMVAMLVDAFPSGRPANPEGYLDAIVHDLVAMRFSPEVVALACQTIRRSCKFLPSVSEVIEGASAALGHFDASRVHALRAAELIERLRLSVARARERALQHPKLGSEQFSDEA
jgi:hypothetical protein